VFDTLAVIKMPLDPRTRRVIPLTDQDLRQTIQQLEQLQRLGVLPRECKDVLKVIQGDPENQVSRLRQLPEMRHICKAMSKINDGLHSITPEELAL
jgi:hypothetical protein